MIEKIIGSLQDAIINEKKIVFELKQFGDDIYFVASDLEKHHPLYQMKLEYTDRNELCEQILFAITSKVEANPSFNFVRHLCCGFGDTIHTDIWIELSPDVSLGIFDKECNFQDWILKKEQEIDNQEKTKSEEIEKKI